MTHSPVCLEMGIGSSSTSDIDLNGSGQHGGTKKNRITMDKNGSKWTVLLYLEKTHIKKNHRHRHVSNIDLMDQYMG